MSSPSTSEPILYHHADGKKLAFLIYDTSEDNILNIPLIRLAKSKNSNTVIRYIIRSAVIKAISEKRNIIIASDMDDQDAFFKNAFLDNDFIKSNQKWMKINVFGLLDQEGLIRKLEKIRHDKNITTDIIDKLIKVIYSVSENNDMRSYVEIEKKLSPLKIKNSNIPCYVIPIKPVWARNLFDETLAKQTLWGGNDNLLMRLENVFYRSKKLSASLFFQLVFYGMFHIIKKNTAQR